MKKQVARNPVTLAQTIRRRILLTAGGALSTTDPGGATDARPPPALPPLAPLVVWQARCPLEFLLGSAGARSGLLELSTNETSVSQEVQRGWQVDVPYEDTRSPIAEQIVQFPAMQGTSLPSGSDFRVNIKSAAPKNFMKLVRSGTYNLFHD